MSALTTPHHGKRETAVGTENKRKRERRQNRDGCLDSDLTAAEPKRHIYNP